jgi:nicotinamidase-related amidase
MTQHADKAPGATALLIIDMINDFDFSDAESMFGHAETIAQVIERMRADAERARVPVVYVNDNYGQWHSERSKIIDYCREKSERGRRIIDRLLPREEDYFIIKPQFSGFYSTNLPVLLPQLGVSRAILTGIAADICVLFTAADAHMRAYDLWVPRDAVASTAEEHRDWALGIMEKSMDAETRASSECRLEEWIARAG